MNIFYYVNMFYLCHISCLNCCDSCLDPTLCLLTHDNMVIYENITVNVVLLILLYLHVEDINSPQWIYYCIIGIPVLKCPIYRMCSSASSSCMFIIKKLYYVLYNNVIFWYVVSISNNRNCMAMHGCDTWKLDFRPCSMLIE